MLRPFTKCAVAAGVLLTASAVVAQEAQSSSGVPDPSIAASLPPDVADPIGLRAALAARGIAFGANYIGEVLANTKGGLERGAIYQGRLELYLDVDFEKAAGWKGLSFHAHGYDIHGEGITVTKVGNLNALSGIEATATTRLLEIWLEQKLFGDALSIRVGQMAVDTEFILADSAGQFISASFGWPTITASNLPNGGSAYPLSAPGVRVELAVTKDLTLRAGAFNDDPAGPCDIDPQVCNPHGLEFRLRDEGYFVGEAEIKYNQGEASPWLPGTLKIGGWYDAARFDDQRFGDDGLSLADPASSGEARQHRGNQGYYVIVDQQIYKGQADTEAVSVFARFMGAPSDRNLVDLYIDGGLKFSGLVPGRPNDSFGIAAAYARISDRAKDFDRDAASFGSLTPIRDDETLIEINYIAQIVPGWTFQPDFQYVWRPGGNAPDATGEKPLEDAMVAGARTTINY